MNTDDFEKKLHDIIEAKKIVSEPFYYAVYVINGWPVTVQLFTNGKIKKILAGGHEIQDIDTLRELRPTDWKLSPTIHNSSITLPKFSPTMTETPKSPNDVFPGFLEAEAIIVNLYNYTVYTPRPARKMSTFKIFKNKIRFNNVLYREGIATIELPLERDMNYFTVPSINDVEKKYIKEFHPNPLYEICDDPAEIQTYYEYYVHDNLVYRLDPENKIVELFPGTFKDFLKNDMKFEYALSYDTVQKFETIDDLSLLLNF